jgi:hypothetical protein
MRKKSSFKKKEYRAAKKPKKEEVKKPKEEVKEENIYRKLFGVDDYIQAGNLIESMANELTKNDFYTKLESVFHECDQLPKDMFRSELLKYADLRLSFNGHLYYKDKWITRVSPLNPIACGIILVKLFGKVIFWSPERTILVSKERIIENLTKKLENDKKELEEFEKKLKKRHESKYYNEMVEIIKRSIDRIQRAIEWIQK